MPLRRQVCARRRVEHRRVEEHRRIGDLAFSGNRATTLRVRCSAALGFAPGRTLARLPRSGGTKPPPPAGARASRPHLRAASKQGRAGRPRSGCGSWRSKATPATPNTLAEQSHRPERGARKQTHRSEAAVAAGAGSANRQNETPLFLRGRSAACSDPSQNPAAAAPSARCGKPRRPPPRPSRRSGIARPPSCISPPHSHRKRGRIAPQGRDGGGSCRPARE
jgi:hypothetical protein